MKLKIKQYEYEQKEIDSREIQLPTEISYYFETGIRRSIRIVPIFRTWEENERQKEIYYLDVVCLYSSSECKAEKFRIYVTELENIYYSEKHEYKDFVRSLVNDWFDVRTKENFEEDLNYIINDLKTIK